MTGLTNASKISQYIKEISRANISNNESTGLYLFNRKNIEEVSVEYYDNLLNDFKKHLYIQLKEKCDIILLNKYLDETKLVKKSNGKLKHELMFRFIDFKRNKEEIKLVNIQNIRKRLYTIEKILNKIIIILEDEIEYFEYRISSDYQQVLNSLEEKIDNLKKSDLGKLTFNMSKKESLMLLFLLEESKLLKFENDIQKKKFIENNFNYTEMRENKSNYGESCEMIGVGKEYTNFTSNDDGDVSSNNKTLEILLKKLLENIHYYQFSIRKYKSS